MRTRAVLAFVVVAVLAIAPGPVVAGGRSLADLPGVSVLVRVVVPEPASRAQRAQAPVQKAAPQASSGVVDVSDVAAPAADLVRVVDILYARGSDATQGFDLGGPCPRASTCDVRQLSGARWKADDAGRVVIPFAYNDEGRRTLRAPDEPAVRASLGRAMAEWSRWNSNIVFRDAGTTDAQFGADGPDGGCSDGRNVVTWGRFPSDVVGAASTCLDRTNRVIRDTDLALNVFHRWADGVNERRPSYDVQSIFTHELGHWLSLADLYVGIDAARQTMYGATDPNETHKRTLALGDIVGVQTAYPCGDGDRCPRSGIRDD